VEQAITDQSTAHQQRGRGRGRASHQTQHECHDVNSPMALTLGELGER
jgi:hypothetical protein